MKRHVLQLKRNAPFFNLNWLDLFYVRDGDDYYLPANISATIKPWKKIQGGACLW
jgi:hypothetical protein